MSAAATATSTRAGRLLVVVLGTTGPESWSPVDRVECHVRPAGTRWHYVVRDQFGCCGSGDRDDRATAVRVAHHIAVGDG